MRGSTDATELWSLGALDAFLVPAEGVAVLEVPTLADPEAEAEADAGAEAGAEEEGLALDGVMLSLAANALPLALQSAQPPNMLPLSAWVSEARLLGPVNWAPTPAQSRRKARHTSTKLNHTDGRGNDLAAAVGSERLLLDLDWALRARTRSREAT